MSEVDTDAVREVALGRLGLNQAEHDLLMLAAMEIESLRERLRRASEELKEREKSRVWQEAIPRIAGQPDHQKKMGWAADPFAQIERLADYCNAVDMVDENSNDMPVVDVVMRVLEDYSKMLVTAGENLKTAKTERDEARRCAETIRDSKGDGAFPWEREES